METTQEVLAFKQRIIREAPGSGAMVASRDKIFYMKEPGVDATISGGGTVSYREGWGQQPHPSRYGGVIAADKALREKGYRPYNIFNGNQYEQYELRHLLARKEKERQQTAFQPFDAPKIKLGRDQSEMELPDISYTQVPEIKSTIFYNQKTQPMGKLSYGDIIERVGPQRKELDLTSRNINAGLMNSQKFQGYIQGQEKLLSGAYRQFGLPNLSGKLKAPVKKKRKGKQRLGDMYELW